jgi:hypothetical protein
VSVPTIAVFARNAHKVASCSIFLPAHNDVGVYINTIVADLVSQGYTEGEVRSAVRYLSNEGHIYSTIDENHFQFAE